MSTIYLIDQSLLDDRGHHADYARCLIEATANAGFKTILAANRRFSKWLKKSDPIRLGETTATNSLPSSPGSRTAEFESRVGHLLAFGEAEICCSFRNTTYSPYSDLADLRRMNRQNSGKIFPWSLWRRSKQEKYIRRFAVDCRTLFEKVDFQNSDHIFFATINELELLGLARFLSQRPDSILPQWHVQFHFGLFLGRPPEYQDQRHDSEIVRQTFMAAMSHLSYQNLNFYTTSAELADQYNRLGVGLFEALPYPISPEFAMESSLEKGATNAKSFHPLSIPMAKQFETDRFKSPLKVTCPGGIRREKGQACYLQSLVDQAWASLIKPQEIQLVLQRPQPKRLVGSLIRKNKLEIRLPVDSINPTKSTTRPETDSNPATIGQTESQSSKSYFAPIIYLPHPLPREEYVRLIQETDIGLLFYDSRIYYSRRAGILGELLAAGKPVIVPAGCWLAEQIAEPNFQYAQRVIAQHSFQRIGLGDIGWSMRNAPAAGGKLSFDHDRNGFHFEFDIPLCHQVGLSFAWVWPVRQGVYCQVDLEFLDDQGDVIDRKCQVIGHRKVGTSNRRPANPTVNHASTLFANQSRVAKVRGSLKNAFSESTICVDQLVVDFIRHADPALSVGSRPDCPPLGTVGAIAPNHAGILPALIEIVKNYQHYSATAAEFAKGWFDDHDPDLIVHRFLREELEFSQVA